MMSDAVQHVFAAGALVDAKKGLSNEALQKEPFKDWPVIENLFSGGVYPVSLVADW